MTTTITLWLPYDRPPLTANQRQHWAARARLTADVRRTAKLLARSAKLPQGLDHIDVALVYVPRDNRRRDADNLVPTLKAACDGLVDAGLVADDTPDLMTKHMPVIETPSRTPPGPNHSRIALKLKIRGHTRPHNPTPPPNPNPPTRSAL